MPSTDNKNKIILPHYKNLEDVLSMKNSANVLHHIVCTLQCVIGCQCKSGFFRDDRNECVAECDNASSNICAVNEEFKQCGTACEPSCENPKPSVCSAQCVVNVCQCKSGFLRNSKEQCVEHCEEDPCPVTEERKVCGTACEPTCSNPKPNYLAAEMKREKSAGLPVNPRVQIRIQ
ncbi:trypsin Inhibitor like cysteine rich domain protein [Necator americanus]|uniref:Trypsin Inhibitor like cysteine rich domain protein n=1 Tax=Necator americanus TaxID=51031 RepID=W2SWI3_NECAM|nr:trypsin Inhibitor like cysteine rich domain protein [Necator americanus]ETN73858.1 trypsin Inhibitor like cysteine rich domain protein [Necator americanus]